MLLWTLDPPSLCSPGHDQPLLAGDSGQEAPFSSSCFRVPTSASFGQMLKNSRMRGLDKQQPAAAAEPPGQARGQDATGDERASVRCSLWASPHGESSRASFLHPHNSPVSRVSLGSPSQGQGSWATEKPTRGR